MRSILLLGVALAASACEARTFEPAAPPGIEIFPQALTLQVDADSQFIAHVSGDFGGPPVVSWRSSATTVASVGSNGLVAGDGLGSALIIVRASGRVMREDTARVDVH